jgi:organic hydroperoxide reductase OsmC/OhrA
MRARRQYPDLAYHTSVTWDSEQHRGSSTAEDRPAVRVSCPPDFGGSEDSWSAQHLFAASVNVCVMTTFTHLAERVGLPILDYRSDATAVATFVGDGYEFTRLVVRPRIEVADDRKAHRARRLAQVAGRTCMITASIQAQVQVESTVVVRDGVPKGPP